MEIIGSFFMNDDDRSDRVVFIVEVEDALLKEALGLYNEDKTRTKFERVI